MVALSRPTILKNTSLPRGLDHLNYLSPTKYADLDTEVVNGTISLPSGSISIIDISLSNGKYSVKYLGDPR